MVVRYLGNRDDRLELQRSFLETCLIIWRGVVMVYGRRCCTTRFVVDIQTKEQSTRSRLGSELVECNECLSRLDVESATSQMGAGARS